MKTIVGTTLALLLSGCAFQPGTLIDGPRAYDHAARRIGCIEVEVGEARDPRVQFTVGNRCRHPVGLDFRNVVVTARGEPGALLPSDRRGELREAVLDAHDSMVVGIDYPAHLPISRFCVDLARLNVDDPAPGSVPICFAWDGSGWLVEDAS